MPWPADRGARGRAARGKATSRAGQCLKTGPGTARSRRMVISEQSSSVTATEPRCRTASPSAPPRRGIHWAASPSRDRTGPGTVYRTASIPARAAPATLTGLSSTKSVEAGSRLKRSSSSS